MKERVKTLIPSFWQCYRHCSNWDICHKICDFNLSVLWQRLGQNLKKKKPIWLSSQRSWYTAVSCAWSPGLACQMVISDNSNRVVFPGSLMRIWVPSTYTDHTFPPSIQAVHQCMLCILCGSLFQYNMNAQTPKYFLERKKKWRKTNRNFFLLYLLIHTPALVSVTNADHTFEIKLNIKKKLFSFILIYIFSTFWNRNFTVSQCTYNQKI